MTNKLIAYAQEVLPNIRTLLKKQEILKEWKADDVEVQRRLQEIKDLQDSLKVYIEETESELVNEIKDLANDIKLACQAAAKGSNYKAAELKSYFTAKAKDKVGDVVEKGEMFLELQTELA